MQENKSDFVRKNFIAYLDSLGLSPKSHKNYRSDLTHFISWLITKVRSFGSYVENLTESVPFLNLDMAREYKNFLSESHISPKTINRRLSTLRHLSHYLVASQTIDFDFTEGVANVAQGNTPQYTENAIVTDFRSFLVAQKVSKNTVKNYVSDVRQFLEWLERHQERPSKPI